MSDTAHGRDDDPLGTVTEARRCFGSMRGQLQVPDSFFEPMSEEELALWEGGSEPPESEEATASGSSDDDN